MYSASYLLGIQGTLMLTFRKPDKENLKRAKSHDLDDRLRVGHHSKSVFRIM
jgi:hypothetical protein